MFNRLLPKRQCIKPYSIAVMNHFPFTRNICGLLRSNHINNECIPNLLLSQHIRYFAKKIKVYNQPDVGEGTVEVDILEWLIKPGDEVKPLQTIGRGKYEKADVDIMAPSYGGILHKIHVESGQVAIVGKPLLEFEIEDDGTPSSPSSTSDIDIKNDNDTPTNIDSNTITKQTGGSIDSKGMLALPATKHYAKEHNIDLSKVIGTGKDGRILKEDVMCYMNGEQGTTTTTSTTIPKIIKPATGKAITSKQKPITHHPSQLYGGTRPDHIEKIFGVKKAMVKKMTEANKVPQFGYSDEIIMNELVTLRKQLKPLGESYGVKITYLPFILKATSMALLNPQSSCLNAYINTECTELTHKGCHNIGIAIDSPEGLIVPNIKFIDQKSVMEIAADLDELIERGRTNQITNDDITGGTFTLSNIGAIGGTYCRPICFVPEVCIGALGAIKQSPRYNEKNELYQASVMAISWSADHRVIDGATVARFSNDFKMYLENPSSMLLHLK